MLRAPAIFAFFQFVAIFAQADSAIPSGSNLAYGAIVCGGFTAVWVKLWLLHSTIIADKNAIILELKTENKEQAAEITELKSTQVERLKEQLEDSRSE